jgi:uncharacterized membrane protein
MSGEKHILYRHKPHPHKPRNVHHEYLEQLTVGQKVADSFASGIGSWTFVIVQAVIMILWMIINTLTLFQFIHFDIFPFVFLNLAMSAEAAFSSPLIMMSQNRQSEKDRLTAQNDYETDMKAEHHIEEMVRHLDSQDDELLRQSKMLEEHYQELCKQTKMLTALLTPPVTVRRRVRKQEVDET